MIEVENRLKVSFFVKGETGRPGKTLEAQERTTQTFFT
jgi:hypothetical protein